MIRSFRDERTLLVFAREETGELSRGLARAALRRLVALDAATSLTDLSAIPSHRLEKLRGDLSGRYSIRINRQWRTCFRWRSGDAYDVELIDCH